MSGAAGSGGAGRTAVLFDLGDVLVRLRFERGLSRFAAAAGIPAAAASGAAALYLGEQALAFNRGEVAPELFLRGLAERLGCAGLPLEACAAAWCDIFDPWPEMEGLAEEVVAAGYPVYLLSNTDPVHFGALRGRLPVLERFAGLHLSYEVASAKPDPAFFLGALQRFDLVAGACVFVDDRAENVESARALGIRAHRHDGDVTAVRAFLRASGVAVG